MPEEAEFGLMDKAPPPSKKKEVAPKKTEAKEEKQSLADEVVTYYSVKRNQRIRMRPPIKQIVNGREFKKPGHAVSFANYRFQTKNKEDIEALDADGKCVKTLTHYKPDIFVKGGDRTPENMPPEELDTCERLGIRIVYNVGEQLGQSRDITCPSDP